MLASLVSANHHMASLCPLSEIDESINSSQLSTIQELVPSRTRNILTASFQTSISLRWPMQMGLVIIDNGIGVASTLGCNSPTVSLHR